MTCKFCGYKSMVAFNRCPVCGRFRMRQYLVALFDGMLFWVTDRRLCLISKRQHFDRSLYRHHLLLPECRGTYRIWWTYRLFDLIPIMTLQDPQSVVVFNPLPTHGQLSKLSEGLMSGSAGAA